MSDFGEQNDFEAPAGEQQPNRQPSSPPKSLTTATWENIKLLADRSLDNGVVLGYVLLAVVSFAASLVAFGAVGAAMVGLAGGIEQGLDSPGSVLSVGLIAAVGVVFVVGMVVWQTVLTGLQRPMHRLMFQGTEAVDGARDALGQAVSRFWSILGVSAIIGVVVWGGAVTSVGVGAFTMLKGPMDSGSPEAMLPVVVLGIGWLIVAAVVCFLFGPATYFVATRDFGVVDALAKSYRFVLDHVVEMLAAWAVIVAVAMAFNFAMSILGMIPCCGQIVAAPLQMAFSFFGALAGLIYWDGFYITLEERDDPSRQIIL